MGLCCRWGRCQDKAPPPIWVPPLPPKFPPSTFYRRKNSWTLAQEGTSWGLVCSTPSAKTQTTGDFQWWRNWVFLSSCLPYQPGPFRPGGPHHMHTIHTLSSCQVAWPVPLACHIWAQPGEGCLHPCVVLALVCRCAAFVFLLLSLISINASVSLEAVPLTGWKKQHWLLL